MRDYGGTNADTRRTGPQTQTALFFSDAGIVPMQAGLRDFATRHALDIDDSARLFAAADSAIADGAITVWNGKLRYMWWRPVTAIRDATIDGNPDTVGLPGGAVWSSRITTPPYPDWPSGLCTVVGAVSTVLERLNGDGTLDLRITSQPPARPGRSRRRRRSTAGRRRPGVEWHPLPDRRRGLDRHRLQRGRLRARSLLPADRLTDMFLTPGGLRSPPGVYLERAEGTFRTRRHVHVSVRIPGRLHLRSCTRAAPWGRSSFPEGSAARTAAATEA